MGLINKVIALLTAFITLISGFLGFGPDNGGNTEPEKFRVTTYIRGELGQYPENIHAEDFDIITDVIVFECASFDNKGNVIVEKEMLEKVLANLRAAIGDRDVHITLNLLGPRGHTDSTDWYEQMDVLSKEHNKAFRRPAFIKNIIAVLDEYDFDGVHFDYEYPLSKTAWFYYNNFLVALDKKLGDYTLGVAASTWNIGYTKKAIKAVDTFEIMTYDFLDDEGRHATYEGMVGQVEALELPREKVNVGLPFYARPSDLSAYWYEYQSCYDKLDENGWYHCPNINKDFWFNTPDVIEAKTDYAIKNGFGGVMVWHYSCDLPSSHEASLTRAMGVAVKNNF